MTRGGVRRTCLSVPASSPPMLQKALGIEADELALDLEDAVVPAAKDQARAAVVRLLVENPEQASRVSVRVNEPRSGWCHLDLIALASSPVPPACVIVPKVDGPEDVGFVERLLDGVQAHVEGERITVQALIESAEGLHNIHGIARSSRLLIGLILGYADLGASLKRRPGGLDTQGQEWDPIRQSFLVAARAADLHAMDGPYLGLQLDRDFEAAVARLRPLGFDGKWAIHPKQLPAIASAFAPTEEEIARALRVVRALAESEVDERAGAVASGDEMLDVAVRRWAVEVLEEAGLSAG